MNGFGQLTTILASDSKIKMTNYFVKVRTMAFTIQICLLKMFSYFIICFLCSGHNTEHSLACAEIYI